jgi:hypothetical protein
MRPAASAGVPFLAPLAWLLILAALLASRFLLSP